MVFNQLPFFSYVCFSLGQIALVLIKKVLGLQILQKHAQMIDVVSSYPVYIIMELAPFGEVCAFQSAAIFLFGSLQFTTKSRTSGKIVHTT